MAKTIRTKEDGYEDIAKGKVFGTTLVTFIIVLFLCAFICGLHALIIFNNNKQVPDYNERAAAFNALSLTERQIIANWIQGEGADEDIDQETYLMKEQEKLPLFLLTRIHGTENVVKVLPYYFVGLLIVLSLCTFFSYDYEKSDTYYLCCLPLYTPYGWVLFFCMFAGWPFLLISFICMRVQRSEFFQKQRAARKKRQLAKKQEKAEVKRLAEEELAEMARELTRSSFPERARRALVAYITYGQPRVYKAQILEATQNIDNLNHQLQEAGRKVQEIQQNLGRAKASLGQLKVSAHEACSREKAEADWMAIRNARGISSIVYNKSRKRLEILIKVRVPYNGELYDFGDYRLYIDSSSKCPCKEVRSGVKFNHTSTAPLYHLSGKHFCFGSSHTTITDYLRNGRYAEAITLVVECLHSVNSDYDASNIPNCFRKVSAVEKAKRHILRRNKFTRIFSKGE